MAKAKLEPNGHGRTFLLINNKPTSLHFDYPVFKVEYINKSTVEVDGLRYNYRQFNSNGVMDNRH